MPFIYKSIIIYTTSGVVRMKEVYLSLPFYGVSGSISKIIRTKDDNGVVQFLRIEYDCNGKEKDAITMPISKTRLGSIKKNFFEDVQEYLNVNAQKINYYQNTKKNINYQNTIQKMVISAISTLFGITFTAFAIQTLPISSITFAGFLITIGSASILAMEVKEHLDYLKEQNKQDKINEYQYYQRALVNFQSEEDKKKQYSKNYTKYQGLNQEKVKGNTIKKTKILEINK